MRRSSESRSAVSVARGADSALTLSDNPPVPQATEMSVAETLTGAIHSLRRRRQEVRQRSAKPPPPVQIRAAPPLFLSKFSESGRAAPLKRPSANHCANH